ncbi:MAG: hypothetical protein AAGN35_04755 [Bacteroidota bacterium]
MGQLRSCALFLVILLPLLVSGQSDWRAGYVVNLSGDTLRGQVRDRDTGPFGGLYNKVILKGEKGSSVRRKRFPPRKMRAYRWGDADFIVLPTVTESVLLTTRRRVDPERGVPEVFQIVVEGPLCLYYDEFTDEDNSDIRAIPYFKRAGNPALVRATQGLFGLKVKRLSEFFADRPDLVRKLQAGTLKTPMDVVRAYGEE